MKKIIYLIGVSALFFVPKSLISAELPRLAKNIDSKTFDFGKQKKYPELKEAYISISPEDLGDGLEVGTLDLPGSKEAIEALVAADKANKFGELDSILVMKDGKLIFEMYNRRGRVNAPHYTMSATKTMSSLTLARAIHLGLLSMEDLDKPIISFMPEIDRSKIKPGTETITLRDALQMKSGLRYDGKTLADHAKGKKGQKYFQALFEVTEPITPETKQFKYSGINPTMILGVIDAKAPGSVREFFGKELMHEIGGTYCWKEDKYENLFGGAGLSLNSRTLLKMGQIINQGGQYKGEQLLSPEYMKLILNRSSEEGVGFFYYFHKRHEYSPDKSKIDFISGVGAGGNYMSVFPDLNVVVAITAHGNIRKPLKAVIKHIIPLFTNNEK